MNEVNRPHPISPRKPKERNPHNKLYGSTLTKDVNAASSLSCLAFLARARLGWRSPTDAQYTGPTRHRSSFLPSLGSFSTGR